MNQNSEEKMCIDIYIDKSIFIGNMPIDITKYLIGLTFEKFIPNKMIKLSEILEMSANNTSLFENNIHFWSCLWLHYISSDKRTLDEKLNVMKNKFILVMKIYETTLTLEDFLLFVGENMKKLMKIPIVYQIYMHISTLNMEFCLNKLLIDEFETEDIHKLRHELMTYFGGDKIKNTSILNVELYNIVCERKRKSKLMLSRDEIHRLDQEIENHKTRLIRIIGKGADLNFCFGLSWKNLPLCKAISSDYEHTQEILIKYGADSSFIFNGDNVKELLSSYTNSRNYYDVDKIVKLRKFVRPELEKVFDDGENYYELCLRGHKNSSRCINSRLFCKLIDNGMDLSFFDNNNNNIIHQCLNEIYKGLKNEHETYRKIDFESLKISLQSLDKLLKHFQNNIVIDNSSNAHIITVESTNNDILTPLLYAQKLYKQKLVPHESSNLNTAHKMILKIFYNNNIGQNNSWLSYLGL